MRLSSTILLASAITSFGAVTNDVIYGTLVDIYGAPLNNYDITFLPISYPKTNDSAQISVGKIITARTTAGGAFQLSIPKGEYNVQFGTGNFTNLISMDGIGITTNLAYLLRTNANAISSVDLSFTNYYATTNWILSFGYATTNDVINSTNSLATTNYVTGIISAIDFSTNSVWASNVLSGGSISGVSITNAPYVVVTNTASANSGTVSITNGIVAVGDTSWIKIIGSTRSLSSDNGFINTPHLAASSGSQNISGYGSIGTSVTGSMTASNIIARGTITATNGIIVVNNGIRLLVPEWDDVLVPGLSLSPNPSSAPKLIDTKPGGPIKGYGYDVGNIAHGSVQFGHRNVSPTGTNSLFPDYYIVPHIHVSVTNVVANAINGAFHMDYEWANINAQYTTISGALVLTNNFTTNLVHRIWSFPPITNNLAATNLSSIFRFSLKRTNTANETAELIIVDSVDLHAPVYRLGSRTSSSD